MGNNFATQVEFHQGVLNFNWYNSFCTGNSRKENVKLLRSKIILTCVHSEQANSELRGTFSTRFGTLLQSIYADVQFLAYLHIPLCLANIPLFIWLRKYKWRVGGLVTGFGLEIAGYQKNRDSCTHPIYSATHTSKLVGPASIFTVYACSESTPFSRNEYQGLF